MRKALFRCVERLDTSFDGIFGYSRALSDPRNSIFVPLTVLMCLTVIPSGLLLVRGLFS